MMKEKIFSTRTLLIVILIGLTLSSLLLAHFNSTRKIKSDSAKFYTNPNVSFQQGILSSPLPVRIRIPKISVDATVEYVGFTSEGRVDVPKGPDRVAWFNLGPRPGEIGSAIIDGHSGYKNNKPAVFDNLYKLEKGDKIYVEDSSGATVTFLVRESRKYNPKANPGEVFVSNDTEAHLNLITCTGLWDNSEKTHSDRLVVFTDLLPSYLY